MSPYVFATGPQQIVATIYSSDSRYIAAIPIPGKHEEFIWQSCKILVCICDSILYAIISQMRGPLDNKYFSLLDYHFPSQLFLDRRDLLTLTSTIVLLCRYSQQSIVLLLLKNLCWKGGHYDSVNSNNGFNSFLVYPNDTGRR